MTRMVSLMRVLLSGTEKAGFLKRILFLLIVFIVVSCATSHYRYEARVPAHIEKYCKKISGGEEGSENAMKTCIRMELDAREQLSRIAIPAEVGDMCRELSESTGGSYAVMLTCVEKEL